MEWEPSNGATAYNFFPGELYSQGANVGGGTGIKSPMVIPGNFWSEPELNNDFYYPTTTVENRSSIALYDYFKKDSPSTSIPGLDPVNFDAIFQTPKSWRNSYFYSAAIFTPSIYIYTGDIPCTSTVSGRYVKTVLPPFLINALSNIVSLFTKVKTYVGTIPGIASLISLWKKIKVWNQSGIICTSRIISTYSYTPNPPAPGVGSDIKNTRLSIRIGLGF